MIAVITALLQGSYRFGDARDGDEVEATRSVCVCVCVCVCVFVDMLATNRSVGRTDGRDSLSAVPWRRYSKWLFCGQSAASADK